MAPRHVPPNQGLDVIMQFMLVVQEDPLGHPSYWVKAKTCWPNFTTTTRCKDNCYRNMKTQSVKQNSMRERRQ